MYNDSSYKNLSASADRRGESVRTIGGQVVSGIDLLISGRLVSVVLLLIGLILITG